MRAARQRGAGQPRQRPQGHLPLRGDALAGNLGGTGPIKRRAGIDVEEHLVQAGGSGPVHQSVVDLHEQSHAAILEALDEPDLPQRAVPLELVAEQVARQGTELARPARGRHAYPADLALEIDVRVVHPGGAVEAKGDPYQATQERPEQPGPGFEQGAQAIHVEAVGGARRVEHHQRPGVHVPTGRLAIDKAGVHATEPLHRTPSTSPVIILCGSARG